MSRMYFVCRFEFSSYHITLPYAWLCNQNNDYWMKTLALPKNYTIIYNKPLMSTQDYTTHQHNTHYWVYITLGSQKVTIVKIQKQSEKQENSVLWTSQEHTQSTAIFVSKGIRFHYQSSHTHKKIPLDRQASTSRSWYSLNKTRQNTDGAALKGD